jgi:hypothetical protein
MTDFLVFPERARQTARDETEFVKKKEARRIVSAATSVKAADRRPLRSFVNNHTKDLFSIDGSRCGSMQNMR